MDAYKFIPEARWTAACAVFFLIAASAFSAPPDPLPVREATVFKNGLAFVIQRGKMPTGADGSVELDRLPSPALGAFWAFSGDPAVKFVSAVSGRKRVKIEKTALNLPDLLRANAGKRARITEIAGKESETTYDARIVGVVQRSAEELDASNPPGAPPATPLVGEIVLLQAGEGPQAGTKAVPVSRVLNAVFLDAPETKVGDEEFRDTMSLRLQGAPASGSADVGLAYLQLGLRWIPSYRVSLDGAGKATVELRATLIDELADLSDAKLNLAIGVPGFKFAGDADPISMQSAALRLASAAGPDSNLRAFGSNFGNAIMNQQQASPQPDNGNAEDRTLDLGPAVEGPGRAEDLFLFPLDHITLKKGERMSIALTSATMTYEDLYTVDLPFTAPQEIDRQSNGQLQRELARLATVPKAIHKVRLNNRGPQPLTTAPALIVKDGVPLGQGLMTYAPAGGSCDLEITTALGIQVANEESETGRAPNAVRMNGDDYTRVNLKGAVRLKSFLAKPAKMIVTRYALGAFDSATAEGKLTNGSPFDAGLMLAATGEASWRGAGFLPWWWASVNGLGKAQWTLDLEPGKEVIVESQWHYFWR